MDRETLQFSKDSFLFLFLFLFLALKDSVPVSRHFLLAFDYFFH